MTLSLSPDRIRLLRLWRSALALTFLLGIVVLPVSAKMVFQIMPTANITEEYSDNYLKESEKQEEFVTSYAAGLSLSVVNENKKVYLSYTPTYRDYKNFDDRDGISHVISLDAHFKPLKSTKLRARANYSGQNNNYQGDQTEQRASLSAVTELGRHTSLDYGHRFSRRFEEQVRTGLYKEHTVNSTHAELTHQYGKKNVFRGRVLYETDLYAQEDPDEYRKVNPHVSNLYWFTPRMGLEFAGEYEDKDFNLDDEDLRTTSGHLKFIRSFSRNLDGYVKYRQTYSRTSDVIHQIYHPSAGVDWDISEDSGISVGAGLLFHNWSDDTESKVDPFIDLSAFKRIEFSSRTALTFTGKSDYTSSGDDAASLGYQTRYRVGAVFTHRFLKELSSSVFGSYTRIEFDDVSVSRTDDLGSIGAGLTWTPLKWLSMNLNYTFSDYQSTSLDRDTYQDNRVFFSVSLAPETPLRPDKAWSRSEFRNRIFNPDNVWNP